MSICVKGASGAGNFAPGPDEGDEGKHMHTLNMARVGMRGRQAHVEGSAWGGGGGGGGRGGGARGGGLGGGGGEGGARRESQPVEHEQQESGFGAHTQAVDEEDGEPAGDGPLARELKEEEKGEEDRE